uniref:Uncharacterized protein n=1 Tax=Magallana gigas TaxID=29159 RepID=A0A8W8MEM1_MAGGI|nr:uncharacterized protein LOC109618875 [Crassostrea gigas]
MVLKKMSYMYLAVILPSFVIFVQGGDSSCWEVGGRCQSTSAPCHYYGSGLCSGPVDRQCCIIGADISCESLGGTCMDNSNYCSRGFIRGRCGGGLSRQCCLSDGLMASMSSPLQA